MGIKEKASQGFREIKEEAKVLKGEKSKDKIYSSSRAFDSEPAAKEELEESKRKLFDVNGWSKIPGVANASFEIYSPFGQPLEKKQVETGDFIKIDLPGPLPFYWVKVNEIIDEEDYAQFTVQPTHDPTKGKDEAVTDHFFQDRARSIFRVEKIGSEITAMEIGLNEAINNQEGESGEKGLINTFVSETGWALFQKHQWKNLTDYLVGIN